MEHLLKKIIFFPLQYAGIRLSHQASILMYHSVGNNSALFTVTPENFERQLAEIKRRNLKTVKLGELVDLLKNKQDISNTVCITFDDGYRDNLEIALPILEKYRMPASFFIATGFLGKEFAVSGGGITLPIMSEEEIRKLSAHPLAEVLPHGHSHRKMSHLPIEEAVADAERSYRELSRILGGTRRILAYPKGKHSLELALALKNADWEAAVTVQAGLAGSESDCLRLPRNSIGITTSRPEFSAKISRGIRLYSSLKNLYEQAA